MSQLYIATSRDIKPQGSLHTPRAEPKSVAVWTKEEGCSPTTAHSFQIIVRDMLLSHFLCPVEKKITC